MTRVLKKVFQKCAGFLLVFLFFYKVTLPATIQDPKIVDITLLNKGNMPIHGATLRVNGDSATYRSNIISVAVQEGQQVEIEFSHPDYETKKVNMVFSGEKERDTIRLEQKQNSGYFYVSKPGLIGIFLSDKGKNDTVGLKSLLVTLDLEIIEPYCTFPDGKFHHEKTKTENIDSYGGIVLRKKNGAKLNDYNNPELAFLRESPLIRCAGPIVSVIGEALRIYSNYISIELSNKNLLPEILNRYNAKLEYSGLFMLLLFDPSIGEGIQEIAYEMNKNKSIRDPTVEICALIGNR
ncbi:MAG TPA: hypothetical protein DIW47_12925 [Bacteroidetes bacterium]|nr:hypothetical protein [Bacteroidota bacterium]